MGIFDRFRKGRQATSDRDQEMMRAPKRMNPEHPPEPATPQSRRLDTETALPSKEVPESNEPTRTIHIDQVLYGKRVQKRGGAIVRGEEHSIKSLTPSSSEEFLDVCHPSNFPFGESGNDDRMWDDEGGTIIKVSKELNGIPHILCGRLKLASENGDGVPGRRYVQAHFMDIPANEWSVSIIPQLADALDNTPPLASEDHEIPKKELKTELLDKSLPDDWYNDEIKAFLRSMIAGQPISIQDYDHSVKEYLQKIFYCSICLPENAARQISFGSGLGDMKGELRFSQGTAAFTENRRIVDRWVIQEGLNFDLSNRYLGELESRISNCKTPREVMKAVNSIPQELEMQVEKNMFPDMMGM